MNSKSIWLLIIVLVLIAAAIFFIRNNTDNEIPAGGPCSYKTETYPAVILAIKPLDTDSLFFDIVFELQADGYTDTLFYNEQLNGFIAKEELDTHLYAVGNAMTYEHRQITSGSCSPDFFELRMEIYKPVASH